LSRKIVVAAVLLALVSAGCGSSRDALTIYSGRTLNLVGPLAANKPRTSANHNAVVEAVSRGESQMGMVDHHLQPPLPAGEPGTPAATTASPATTSGRWSSRPRPWAGAGSARWS
jgi:hypothetical protein